MPLQCLPPEKTECYRKLGRKQPVLCGSETLAKLSLSFFLFLGFFKMRSFIHSFNLYSLMLYSRALEFITIISFFVGGLGWVSVAAWGFL